MYSSPQPLPDGPTAAALRKRAVAVMDALTISDDAVAYGLRLAPGGARLTWGYGGQLSDRFVQSMGTSAWPELNRFAKADARARQGFVESAVRPGRRAYESYRVVQDTLLVNGVTDQMRMLVFDNARFVASCGFFRGPGAPRFTAKERRHARAVAGTVGALLVAADKLERGFGQAQVLVRPDGRIEYASETAHKWLVHPGVVEQLGAAARAIDGGRDMPRMAGILRASTLARTVPEQRGARCYPASTTKWAS